MTKQLGLQIVKRVPLRADNFVEHSGVSLAVSAISKLLSTDRYGLIYVRGAIGSGKSHLAVHYSASDGVAVLESGQFQELLGSGEIETKLSEYRGVIIDDADEYLNKVLPGSSGEFVSFVERMRVRRAAIVLLGTLNPEQFPCDDHIMSRLREGLEVELQEPSDEELAGVLSHLAHQRGLMLKPRFLQYLKTRSPRDIPRMVDLLDTVSSDDARVGFGSFDEALRGKPSDEDN